MHILMRIVMRISMCNSQYMPGPEKSNRKPTNLTLSKELLVEAKALNINVSRAAEEGIARAVAEAQAERWRSENKRAFESSNEYVQRNGLPLSKYRKF